MTGKVVFMKNNSEVNKAVKNAEVVETITCKYLDEMTILEPVIQCIESAKILSCNYCYIEDFKRYYFMGNPTLLTGGIMQIPLSVDVISSWWDEIKENEFLITTSGVADGETEPRYQNKMITDEFQIQSPQRDIETIFFCSDSSDFSTAFKFSGNQVVMVIAGASTYNVDGSSSVGDTVTDNQSSNEETEEPSGEVSEEV